MLRNTLKTVAVCSALALGISAHAAEYTTNASARAYNSFSFPPPGATTDPHSGALSSESNATQSAGSSAVATSFASASESGLKAASSASSNSFGFAANAGNAGSGSTDFGASAMLQTDALIFSSLDPFATGLTPRLNLDLSGDILTSVDSVNSGSAGAQAFVFVRVTIAAADGSDTPQTQTGRYYVNRGTNGIIANTSTGILAGYTGGPATIQSDPFDVDPETLYTLQVTLGVAADVNNSTPLPVSASSDFSHTLTFAQSGPVFTLGAGETANAPDVGIVLNDYVAVPEPMSLAGLVVAGGVFVRRRTARQ